MLLEFQSAIDKGLPVRMMQYVAALYDPLVRSKAIDLADGRKLPEGHLEHISPVKVPRLIGKKNSMINMIASACGCDMVVGRNGSIFVSHKGNHELARVAIRMIEEQAHTAGLTDRVAALLAAETGKSVQAMPDAQNPVRNQ